MKRGFWLGLWLGAAAAAAVHATELGIDGTRFTIDGNPVFLLGISDYGALGARPRFIREDLDDMRRLGFNWIRVWATWNAFGNDVSAIDARGRARPFYMKRLEALLQECDRRGMIVDITLSRGDGKHGAPRLPTLAAHLEAVKTLTAALHSYRNWYFDIANERNIRDKRFVSIAELRTLRDAIKHLDPARLVTASHAGGDLPRRALRDYLEKAKLDFLAPHRPRNARSPAQTAPWTRKCREWRRAIHHPAPILFQEPFRRGFRPRYWEPPAAAFLTDLRGALTGGAAGWCFHNGDQKNRPGGRPRRSFDMREQRLFDQLDPVERRVVSELGRIVTRFSAPGPLKK